MRLKTAFEISKTIRMGASRYLQHAVIHKIKT